MKQLLKQLLNTLMLFIVLTMMVVHFNSCENYSEDELFAEENNSECVVGVDCPANANSLQILLNSPVNIANNLSFFPVSGLCDSSDFQEHRIQFKIRNSNNQVVQSSAMAGVAYESECLNGGYQLNVKTPCGMYAADQVNCLGLSQPVILSVEIVGLDAGVEVANPDLGLSTKTVTIAPFF